MRLKSLIFLMILFAIAILFSSESISGLYDVEINAYNSETGDELLWSGTLENVNFEDGAPTDDILEMIRSRAGVSDDVFVEMAIDGEEIDGPRLVVPASSLHRGREPGETGEATEELDGELQIGFPGEELYVASDVSGFGDDAPNERVTVDGAVSMSHGTAPTATSGFGKIYVDASDGHLYYMEATGATTDLLEASSSGTGASMAAVSGEQYDLCIGEPMRFPVHLAGGEEPYTHTWSGDTGPLSATDIPNPIFMASSAGIYDLTYTITDAEGDNSYFLISITVHEDPSPTISADPPMGGCSGQPVVLDAGGCFARYCWDNGGPCDKSFSVTEPGEYEVTVIDDYGCQGTASITVSFLPSPVANIGSAVGACDDATNPTVGGSPAASGGSSPYFYEWTGSGAPYLSSTSDANPTFDVTAASVGVYNLMLEITDDNGCTDTDGPITVTVYENPSVVASSNSPVCPGDELRLSATPSGGTSPYNYSWNGPGGFTSTDASPIISSATLSNDGTYSVTVTDAHSCVSASATTDVTVYEQPAITSDPSNLTICEGLDAGFSVTATGEGISYQWQRNSGSGFLDITGATGPNLTVSSVTPSMDGYQYQCVVSGTCSPSATSASATLNVNAAPNVDTQPTNTTVCAGETATFDITASGYSIAYQWQVNSGSGWSNVSGGTSNTLNITSPAYGDDGNEYRCIVSGGCSPADTSDAATMTVRQLTNITSQPSDATVDEGDAASFSVTAEGYSLTYQWQVNTGSGWTNVSGTSDTYDIGSATEGMDGYEYRCIVSGYCTPPDTSDAATLTVVTSLYAFESHTFTNAGKTGRTGPSLTQCRSAYSTSWDEDDAYFNMSTTGIQEWTVPEDATYRITCAGGAGGTQRYSGDYPGGDGAIIRGDFDLTRGEVIYILVGQKGEDTRSTSEDNAAPGGGGGSFVYSDATDTYPMIAAGGGGGGGRCSSAGFDNHNAEYSTSGNRAGNVSNGGSSGNGGRSNDGSSSYWAGGGSGWLTDGTGGDEATNYDYTPGSSGAYGGRAPRNGAIGGTRYNDGNDEGGDGGFGGGGGGGSDNMGTGGGGGYSGGGGARGGDCGNERGGGAGSYNGGDNQADIGMNSGHGYVTIEKL
ncbi:MAG: hypothetical protein ACLFSQ_06860 [Candidatus Zixiibacteriota bacterium]